MIKETTKKIHFIPYTATKGKEKDTSEAPTINLNRKSGVLWFGNKALTEMGMRDKFVRFYFEPVKKVIGWQIRDKVNQTEMKNWRLVKSYENAKTGGSYWTASLRKMVAQMPLTRDTYKGVQIQKYREINPLSEYKNEVFYFVELVDNPEELRKGLGNESLGQLAVV